MKFHIRRKEIVHASLLGLCTGIIGVLLFILLLNSIDSNANNKVDERKVPVSSTTKENESKKEKLKDGTYEQFYANQHGVFSSFEAATEFVSDYSSLNTSAIVEVDNNFYVWSQVSPTKEDLLKIEQPSSFVKPFKMSGASCEKKELQQLPTLLKNKDRSKFYFDDTSNKKNLPSDWHTITVALTSLSNDLSIIRMHLLAHYFSKNDCLKIEF